MSSHQKKKTPGERFQTRILSQATTTSKLDETAHTTHTLTLPQSPPPSPLRHPPPPHMIQTPPSESTRRPTRTGMRLIVPLQGVVQGRGGILLGSLIPCALFYFLQFYLKRNRSPPPKPPSRSTSSANLSELPRSSSRPNLLSRGASMGRVQLSGRANHVAKPDESPYYIGLDRVREDAYDEVTNPDGVMQLGLAENRVNSDV